MPASTGRRIPGWDPCSYRAIRLCCTVPANTTTQSHYTIHWPCRPPFEHHSRPADRRRCSVRVCIKVLQKHRLWSLFLRLIKTLQYSLILLNFIALIMKIRYVGPYRQIFVILLLVVYCLVAHFQSTTG